MTAKKKRGGDMQEMISTLNAVLFSIAGGLARVLNGRGRKRLRVGAILAEVFIAGVAGIAAVQIARALGGDGPWVNLACIAAGWLGPRFLNLLPSSVLKKMEIDERQRAGTIEDRRNGTKNKRSTD